MAFLSDIAKRAGMSIVWTFIFICAVPFFLLRGFSILADAIDEKAKYEGRWQWFWRAANPAILIVIVAVCVLIQMSWG